MNTAESSKKLQSAIKSAKCKNKGCLSGGNDNLQIVWFGKQYEQKVITCSSCFIMNDEAVKKSVPTEVNVLPVSAFLNKFVSEAKIYEQNRNSNKWEPLVLKGIEKQHQAEVQSFDFKLNGTLKSLVQALQGFAKKIASANQNIYNNVIFNELIEMYSNDKMEDSLKRIQLLIKYLNYGQDGMYRFDDLQLRQKRTKKLTEKINQVTDKILNVLDNLLHDIQQKNAVISKI